MKKKLSPSHAPVTIVLFGATGDLAIKKIFPALHILWKEKHLHKNFRIIAVSRREWTSSDFRSFLDEKMDVPASDDFLNRIEYSFVELEESKGYENLRKTLNEFDVIKSQGRKLFYVSLAPKFYTPVIQGLRKAKILKKGRDAILVEKPFGTSEQSARALDKLLLSFLAREQIYRMDHYLGKETLQAIMRIHEETRSLGYMISAKTVKSIRIRLFETKGIENRGASYDGVGAFRDVGQNHMLETLAVVTALSPKKENSATAWHDSRAKVLESLTQPLQTCEFSRRGQYEGYRSEKNVAPNSQTETAFEVVTSFSKGTLKDVPLVLESGKMMQTSEALVVVSFKEESGLPKKIEFHIQPEQSIVIYHKKGPKEVIAIAKHQDAYANIIKDALIGLRRHFVGSREIEAAWRYADRIVSCWSKVPLETYSKDRPFATKHGF